MVRMMNAEEKAVYAVLSKALALIGQGNPLYEQFSKACTARVCTKPPVDNEADLLRRARQIIEASEG